MKIRCLDRGYVPNKWTEGKIYSVENGCIIDDEGESVIFIDFKDFIRGRASKWEIVKGSWAMRCVDSCGFSFYTTGKIYEVENGMLIDDDYKSRSITKTFEEWVQHSMAEWELVKNMTNRDKYQDAITDAIINKGIKNFGIDIETDAVVDCSEIDGHENCALGKLDDCEDLAEWLDEEYVKKYKLTDKEKIVLKFLKMNGCKYIAREEPLGANVLRGFHNAPFLTVSMINGNIWETERNSKTPIVIDSDYFKMIKSTDKKPFDISRFED